MAISAKWKVPTIYKAYFLGIMIREYHHKLWPSMVEYLLFRVLKFPWYNVNPRSIHPVDQ